jgi:hypothetical protein
VTTRQQRISSKLQLQHLCAYMCMLGALHSQAVSVKQPPAERLPVPELAERGNAKAWQLHCQWGRQGSSRERGNTSGDQDPMPNQTVIFLSPTFSVSLLGPTPWPTHLPCLSSVNTPSNSTCPHSLQGSQKCSHWDQNSLVPGLTRTCLPILARDS